MKITLVITLGAVALLAIWSFSHRYEIRPAANNVVYRCDHWTGRVEASQNAGEWIPIKDKERPIP